MIGIVYRGEINDSSFIFEFKDVDELSDVLSKVLHRIGKEVGIISLGNNIQAQIEYENWVIYPKAVNPEAQYDFIALDKSAAVRVSDDLSTEGEKYKFIYRPTTNSIVTLAEFAR